MLRHLLRRIHRTVLSACTAKRHHQVLETTIHIAFHREVHQLIRLLQEWLHLAVLLQELYHRLVHTRKVGITLVLTRVVHRTAVKHKSTTIARRVSRNTFLIRETHHPHYQWFAHTHVLKLLHLSHLLQHLNQVWIILARMLQQMTQVIYRKWNGLQEVGFLLEVPSKAVCTKHLHRAEQHKVLQRLIEHLFIYRHILLQFFEIYLHQFFAQVRMEVRLSLPEERCHIIEHRTFSSSLEINKVWHHFPNF